MSWVVTGNRISDGRTTIVVKAEDVEPQMTFHEVILQDTMKFGNGFTFGWVQRIAGPDMGKLFPGFKSSWRDSTVFYENISYDDLQRTLLEMVDLGLIKKEDDVYYSCAFIKAENVVAEERRRALRIAKILNGEVSTLVVRP